MKSVCAILISSAANLIIVSFSNACQKQLTEDNNLIDNVPLEVTQLPQLRDLILANNDLEGNFPAVNFTSTNINIIEYML